MIKGENSLDKGMEFIRNSQFTFILTGSRFFGNNTERSDYDFMIEESNNNASKKSLYEALRKAGFTSKPKYKNNDIGIIECYEYKNQNISIDIQIVKDIDERILLDKALKESGLYILFRTNFNNKLDIAPIYKFANILFRKMN
jgi:hypothetical protein